MIRGQSFRELLDHIRIIGRKYFDPEIPDVMRIQYSCKVSHEILKLNN